MVIMSVSFSVYPHETPAGDTHSDRCTQAMSNREGALRQKVELAENELASSRSELASSVGELKESKSMVEVNEILQTEQMDIKQHWMVELLEVTYITHSAAQSYSSISLPHRAERQGEHRLIQGGSVM